MPPPETYKSEIGSQSTVKLRGSVIRLSLGKLLVNLLQVVKRTNTPLIPRQMASSAGLEPAREITMSFCRRRHM